MSSRGMPKNVAKALGYSTERQAPQSATCHRCGSTLYFDSNMIGQTIENCPRGCYSKNISAGRADPAAAEALAKQLEEARNEETRRELGKVERNRDRFGEKICELEGCGMVFVPRAGNQRFCSQGCATIWTGRQRGNAKQHRTLGVLGGDRRRKLP